MNNINIKEALGANKVAAIESKGIELYQMLDRLVVAGNTTIRCYTKRPENFALSLKSLEGILAESRKLLSGIYLNPEPCGKCFPDKGHDYE